MMPTATFIVLAQLILDKYLFPWGQWGVFFPVTVPIQASPPSAILVIEVLQNVRFTDNNLTTLSCDDFLRPTQREAVVSTFTHLSLRDFEELGNQVWANAAGCVPQHDIIRGTCPAPAPFFRRRLSWDLAFRFWWSRYILRLESQVKNTHIRPNTLQTYSYYQVYKKYVSSHRSCEWSAHKIQGCIVDQIPRTPFLWVSHIVSRSNID